MTTATGDQPGQPVRKRAAPRRAGGGQADTTVRQFPRPDDGWRLVPGTTKIRVEYLLSGPNRGLRLVDTTVTVAALPYLHAVMVVRDGRGARRSSVYLMSATPDGPRCAIGAEDIRRGAYIDRLGLHIPEDKTIRDAAVTVLRMMAASMPEREAVARWEDDRLMVPPPEMLPDGYLSRAGTEDDARAAWRELGELACRPGAEHLALNLGAAYAAPYPAALSSVRPVSFAMVGIGEPRKGKTTNANAAAGWWGSPLMMNPPVSESTVAIGDTLAGLGCLPFFRDEAHASGWSPHQWHQHFMRTLNGAGRRRAGADGSGTVRSTAQWWGVQWWTGNVDVRYGATDGVQARVVALADPHLPDKPTAERVTELLELAHGWPIVWQLRDHLTPAALATLARQARADLGDVPAGAADTVAHCLSLAVAGAECAGRLVGAPGLRAAALVSARRVIGALVDTLADQPADAAERLLQDVWADVQAHPGLYPTRADYEAMLRGTETDLMGRPAGRPAARDVHGFRWDHSGRPVVSMTRGGFAAVTAEAEYTPAEALDALRSRHLLVVGGDRRGRLHSIKILGYPDRFYTFRAIPEPTEVGAEEPVTTPDPTPVTTPVTTETTPVRPPDQEGNDSNDGNDASRATPTQPREGWPSGVTRCPTCGADRGDPDAWWQGDAWHLHGGCQRAAPEPVAPVDPPEPAAKALSAIGVPITTHRTGSAASGGPGAAKRRGSSQRSERDAAFAEACRRIDAGEPLRLLEDLAGPFAPRRAGRAPYWRPELPGISWSARPVSSWGWERPYDGPAVRLDRSAAWPSAASSVDVAHGALEHTGATEWTGAPGYYLVEAAPWPEADRLPHPLGPGITPGDAVWVPHPTMGHLAELAEAGRYADATASDSYTAEPVRLREWSAYVAQVREYAASCYGRNSDQWDAVKRAIGQTFSLMLGHERTSGQGWTWDARIRRRDWTHAVQAQAAVTLWRDADRCLSVAPEMGPVALANVDELWLPESALEIVTTAIPSGRTRPPIRIDEMGLALGTYKVKGEGE